jgi:mono/diheme cytochrome c family protein
MMKTISSCIAFTIATLICCGVAAAQTPAAGNLQNGKALFIKHGCARCHGTEGQGGAGARIGSKPPATAALIQYVRNPSGGMPPYRNQVTDAELTDIRTYLASIPPPLAVKDIPLLNQ